VSRQTKLSMSSCILHLILQVLSLVNGVALPVAALAGTSGALADGEDGTGALLWKDVRQRD